MTKMKKTLRPFQQKGAQFLAANYHALLGDEPGLGKTVQAIAAVEALGLKKILVVCPASVRLGWLQEINECLGSSWGWRVISYNEATKLSRTNHHETYDALILDEAHFLKTPESQRTQAIFGNKGGIARRARYIWCLTGTPVLNRPRELFPILKTLHPHFANMSFTAYADIYCGAFFDGRGMNTKGATNLDDLKKKLGSFMLRRTKEEVLPELPPKIISRVPLDVSWADLKTVRDEEDAIGSRETKISSIHEDYSQLGDMAHLLRLTGEAKTGAAATFVADLLETVPKVVVFAKHRNVMDILAAEFAGRHITAVQYHGGMNDVQKRDAVKDFQSRAEVFIGQIQAAGTGINGLQTVCSDVVFAELSWVPGEVGQAVDRCHRIGQVAASVNVYMLHVPGTLESAVLGVHDKKARVIEHLMDDEVLKGLL